MKQRMTIRYFETSTPTEIDYPTNGELPYHVGNGGELIFKDGKKIVTLSPHHWRTVELEMINENL